MTPTRPELARTPRGVDRHIAPDDQMWEGKFDHYFEVGADALRCVRLALSSLRAPEPRRILDLPCGHGRVLRWLRSAWPEAELFASDLDEAGVAFCAERFEARPVVARLDPAETDIAPQSVDLVWIGSLFTHLDRELWEAYFLALDRWLPKGGVAVFTTHGRFIAHSLRHGELFHLDPEVARELVTGFDEHEFAWAPYPGQEHYGFCLSAVPWVVRGLLQFGQWRLVSLAERGWAEYQDVYAIEKM